MKVELNVNDLQIILQTLGQSTIKGVDAVMFGKLYEKIEKAVQKRMKDGLETATK